MTEDALIYLVDDDRDLREAIQESLEEEGLPTRCFSRALEALNCLDSEWPGVVVSDIKMPGLSGIEFLAKAKKQAPEIPFVMITAHGDIKTAIATIKSGAYDFIEKPASPEHLINVIRRALDMRRLKLENSRLLKQIDTGGYLSARILGNSRAIKSVRTAVLSLTPLTVDVVIIGKTGTGKELVARCIHDFSKRSEQEFVVVDCAAHKGEHYETDWLGADGYFEQARDGTIFLDELESIDTLLQTRLLRYLDEHQADPNSPRIIATLKNDPAELLRTGKLRNAFFHRLNVTQINLPLLVDRGNDLALLMDYFLRDAAARHHLKPPASANTVLKEFQGYDWPGNVRELRNTAEKLVIGLDVQTIDQPIESNLNSLEYSQAMEEFERKLLKNALLQAGGHKGKAAQILNIPRKRLYLRMKQCGL